MLFDLDRANLSIKNSNEAPVSEEYVNLRAEKPFVKVNFFFVCVTGDSQKITQNFIP